MTYEVKTNVRFSLVLATVHRTAELERAIASLSAQTLRDFELIIVDQNTDGRLTPIVARWNRSMRCLHVRAGLGLSKARNVGLACARGELVGFPDDDCWYPEDFLENVSYWFETHPKYSLLSTCARDEYGAEVASRWPRESCVVDQRSVLLTCTSFCLFLRRASVMAAEGFDENMGLGSGTLFQSAEDLDLALRVIAREGFGWFEKSIVAGHPRKDAASAPVERAFHYGAGFGHLLRKHRYGFLRWMYHVVRALAGASKAICSARFREARFYWNSARGRIAGYCDAS